MIKTNELKVHSTVHIPGTYGGEVEFGRGCQNFYELGDRLNWATLIALRWDCMDGVPLDFGYAPKFWETHSPKDFRNLMSMIVKSLKKYVGCEKVVFHLVDDRGDEERINYAATLKRMRDVHWGKNTILGYIDHQSMFFETPGNLGIFERQDILDMFLFNTQSIVCERSDELNSDDEEYTKTFYYRQWYDED
jgi:hypothetical protein